MKRTSKNFQKKAAVMIEKIKESPWNTGSPWLTLVYSGWVFIESERRPSPGELLVIEELRAGLWKEIHPHE